ncbi:hypothetical protein NMY22_g18931 [Coprinellus aureogranulatus]|nr:hypothetical protein NMY22_g18931 [Coprinellus aureogranulatus]
MWFPTPTDLEPLPDLQIGGELNDLPQIRPTFFFSPLKNEPQDPILEAIRIAQTNPQAKRPYQHPSLNIKDAGIPKELAILTADLGGLNVDGQLDDGDDGRKSAMGSSPVAFWSSVIESQRQASVSLAVPGDMGTGAHWNYAERAAYYPGIDFVRRIPAERPLRLFCLSNMIAFWLLLGTESSHSAHEVTVEELHRSLRMTVIGASSRLFKWDPVRERFLYIADGTRHLRVKERDEVISASITDRFLNIGMMLRRLEEFIKVLQLRTVKDGPTVHALAHSLSTVLVYLRETLFKISFTDDTDFLTAVWTKYGPYEDILNALSNLYGRGPSIAPQDYPPFDSSAVHIISLIYRHLSIQLERQCATTISAIFAYILQTTSKGYLREVGVSVGFGGQPRKPPPKADEDSEEYYGLDDEGEEEEEHVMQAIEKIQTEFPAFFPKPLLDLLPNAQKSLILLRRARPDHPLLGEESKHKRVRWLWTEHEILTAWDEANSHTPFSSAPASSFQTPAVAQSALGPSYPPEIAETFRVFDTDPGSFRTESALQVIDRSSSILETFIEQFPPHFPPVTPTLEHLTSLVFHKLLDHASTLSTTLLSIFLTSSDNLNFQLHLRLLRGYLLATEPAFKQRLLEALFSDRGEYGVDESPHGMSIRSARRRRTKSGKPKESKQPWAVGISGSLLEREIWPPVGGDLSFFLRTVIVDSLETQSVKDVDDDTVSEAGQGDGDAKSVVSWSGGAKKQHVVLEEAAWRVGFAIRDLPVGNGKEGWMNPLSIEALDFLYIDYKPPRPMDVLISPHILSKYQRVFAFILRIFRGESFQGSHL